MHTCVQYKYTCIYIHLAAASAAGYECIFLRVHVYFCTSCNTHMHICHMYIYVYICICKCVHVYGCVCICVCACVHTHTHTYTHSVHVIYVQSQRAHHIYGVATVSRLFKRIGLFCKRALEKRRYSAKETYSFKEPTNRRHPIREVYITCRFWCWNRCICTGLYMGWLRLVGSLKWKVPFAKEP